MFAYDFLWNNFFLTVDLRSGVTRQSRGNGWEYDKSKGKGRQNKAGGTGF